MKVLRVSGGLDPAFGGPTASTLASCLAAQRAGVATTLVFPVDTRSHDSSCAEDVARLAREGVEIRSFPLARRRPKRSRRSGVSLPLARWLLREGRRFDVVHAHGAWAFPTLVCLLAAKAGRRRVVLSPHEGLTDFDIAKSRWPARAAKRLLRAVYLRAFDLVVTASALELQASRAGRARARCVVVPHPVEAREPRAGKPGRPNGCLRLGYLGRLDPKKNLDVLIGALAQLPPEVELLVAGGGPGELRRSLVDLSRARGVGDRIEWLGFLDGTAKHAFFRSIDLLAMPSAFEGFGVAAAEALAAGVPVLVSTRAGIADVVERYGCGFVSPPSAEPLAAVVASLLEEPQLLRDAAARTRTAAEEELSLAAHGRRLRREYLRLAGLDEEER